MREPSCTISIIPETKIIKSEPYGSWTPEYTIKNRENIINLSKKIGGGKWGFLGMIVNMDPILDPKTSEEFSKFHPAFEEKGCIGIAFVVGRKVVIKAQAQRHHDTSSALKLQIRHFHEEEEALEWLKSLGL